MRSPTGHPRDDAVLELAVVLLVDELIVFRNNAGAGPQIRRLQVAGRHHAHEGSHPLRSGQTFDVVLTDIIFPTERLEFARASAHHIF